MSLQVFPVKARKKHGKFDLYDEIKKLGNNDKLKTSWKDKIPEDIDKLWTKFSKYFKICIAKDKKYLRTFASYDDNEESFSDRNVFPIGCIKELKKILI